MPRDVDAISGGTEVREMAFVMGRHARLGENSGQLRNLSDDVLRKIFRFIRGWNASLANWNMSFPKSWIVDVNGGQRGTVVADVSFRTGIHYWEVTVADFRTICVGVCEMPKNPRLLSDKWLGEIGYAVSASTCSGGTAFLWSKEQLSTFTVKSFTSGQERTLEYYLDGERLHRISPDQKASDSKDPAFSKLPPGPLYPACSNGFDKAFCRAVELTLELPIPAGYLALRAQRRADQAKAETAAPARPAGAPAAAATGAAAAPAAAGAAGAAAAAASATSAADVMKAPAPAPTAAAAMLGNPPQKK